MRYGNVLNYIKSDAGISVLVQTHTNTQKVSNQVLSTSLRLILSMVGRVFEEQKDVYCVFAVPDVEACVGFSFPRMKKFLN